MTTRTQLILAVTLFALPRLAIASDMTLSPCPVPPVRGGTCWTTEDVIDRLLKEIPVPEVPKYASG